MLPYMMLSMVFAHRPFANFLGNAVKITRDMVALGAITYIQLDLRD